MFWCLLTYLPKAFDCLSHDLLLAKLFDCDCNIKALRLILSYLCNRKQQRKINIRFSLSEKSLFDVPLLQTFVMLKTAGGRFEDVFHLCFQMTSSRRPDQHRYARLGLTSSKRLQDVLKMSCERSFKTFLSDAQDVLQRCLQDVLKTTSISPTERKQVYTKSSIKLC